MLESDTSAADIEYKRTGFWDFLVVDFPCESQWVDANGVMNSKP